MNVGQLEKGKKLLEVIKVTKEGIEELKSLAEKRFDRHIDDMNDGQYWFSISEHTDGSGKNAKLTRSLGNAELLDTIIESLETQLNKFEKEFEEL